LNETILRKFLHFIRCYTWVEVKQKNFKSKVSHIGCRQTQTSF